MRALTTLYGPIRAEFGRHVAHAIEPAGRLVASMFLIRALRQTMNMDRPLEFQSATAGNVPMRVGYLVAAAMFNFGFLALLLMRLVRRLPALSQRHPLAGLLSRRVLAPELGREWRRFRRSSVRFAVLAIDIAHVKRVNDVHGHAGGDAVLARVAQQLSLSARETETVARLGGEEFPVVAAWMQANRAMEAAAACRRVALPCQGCRPQSRVRR